jgi:hypothetical protein
MGTKILVIYLVTIMIKPFSFLGLSLAHPPWIYSPKGKESPSSLSFILVEALYYKSILVLIGWIHFADNASVNCC